MPEWLKPQACTSSGCVEVSVQDGDWWLRDLSGRTVRYSSDEWRDFITAVKAGQFDVQAP